jgi:hypothetical protein
MNDRVPHFLRVLDEASALQRSKNHSGVQDRV